MLAESAPQLQAGSGEGQQQHAVPLRLDRREGGEEGQSDAGGPAQEAGLLRPAARSRGAGPGASEPSHPMAWTPQVEGSLQPEERCLPERLVAGGPEETMEDVGEAGGTVAQAGFHDGDVALAPLRRAAGRGEGLPLPVLPAEG